MLLAGLGYGSGGLRKGSWVREKKRKGVRGALLTRRLNEGGKMHALDARDTHHITSI